ncbi:hypothetical protein QBC46DRAFT_46352 [Diplogelasinospora grovesii]|uniref:Rhodopsin domain-containing protein n=1 Tax=Diplogelasinospora grovesii TaxID=303347 RepID=A0AAN6S0S2_9PEZI|nr:hypothetical protein QBC46DRAFT_46352 [Diplogelasinospora grovesii]
MQKLFQRDLNIFFSPEQVAQIDWNYHSTLAPAIWRVNLTFIVLVGVVVSLRIFTRAYITRHFFVDDVLIVFAAIFTLVSSSTALAATRYGLGQHVWNLPMPVENMLDELKHCVQLMFVANVFYAAATAFTKVSIITSYLRIFPHELLRRILYATSAVVVGLGISAIFATIFQCKLVEAAWDFAIVGGQCYAFIDFLYANSAINIATDFVLCLAPLPYFWGLSLPVKQRLSICLLFGIGFIASIASIIRIATLHEVQGIDVTHYLVSPLDWTVIECSLGIICVSIPPMRPLFAKLAPGLVSQYLSRHTAANAANKYDTPGTRSQPRTQQEIIENINREMDRQLVEFEMAEQKRKQSDKSAVIVSTNGSMANWAHGKRYDISPV